MTEQDLRNAFDRMVAAGPPPPGATADVLAAGRRARRRRSLLTIAAAAVAAVAVLTAGSLLLRPAPAPTTAVRPTPTAPPAPTVPGISATQARGIVLACASAYGAKPGPAGLQLYNAIRTPWGMRYLIYGPNTYISCLKATEGDIRTSGRNESMQWLGGPVMVDWGIVDGAPYDRGPGVFSAEGRLAPSVATLRVRHGSSEVTVPAVNGTFMISMSIPAAELGSDEGSWVAYDSAGRRLSPPEPADPIERKVQLVKRCWVSPDGTVVLPSRLSPQPGEHQQCLPATRWR